MCLLIVSPKGRDINMEHLRNASFYNGDGFGLMTYNKQTQKVDVFQTLDFEAFERHILEHRELFKETVTCYHLRLSTAGTQTLTNCHPFPTYNGWLMHNGHISEMDRQMPKSGAHLSDTAKLAFFLGQMKPAWGALGTKILLEGFLGSNRVVVLDKTGKAHIFNESLGSWLDGNWYSNCLYHEKPSPASLSWWDFNSFDLDESSQLDPNEPISHDELKREKVLAIDGALNILRRWCSECEEQCAISLHGFKLPLGFSGQTGTLCSVSQKGVREALSVGLMRRSYIMLDGESVSVLQPSEEARRECLYEKLEQDFRF